jgi:RNA polymerase sigma factor (sigma-70 family)
MYITETGSTDESSSLVVAARGGGESERAELVKAFMPRIAAVARDYRDVRAVSREELMQAGVLGLVRALDRYDPARGNQFWTYARSWVRQAMQELVSSLNNVVVFSDRALRHLARVNAARRQRSTASHSEPSTHELAAVTGLSNAHIGMLVGASQPAQGLDEPFDGKRERGLSLAETLGDPVSEDPFDHVTLRVAASSLPAAFSTLTARELSVIQGRYGIDGEPRTLSELAAQWRVSRERVSQIERVAMRKLRESCDMPSAATAAEPRAARRRLAPTPGGAGPLVARTG